VSLALANLLPAIAPSDRTPPLGEATGTCELTEPPTVEDTIRLVVEVSRQQAEQYGPPLGCSLAQLTEDVRRLVTRAARVGTLGEVAAEAQQAFAALNDGTHPWNRRIQPIAHAMENMAEQARITVVAARRLERVDEAMERLRVRRRSLAVIRGRLLTRARQRRSTRTPLRATRSSGRKRKRRRSSSDPDPDLADSPAPPAEVAP
jgi:hypothetical protein